MKNSQQNNVSTQSGSIYRQLDRLPSMVGLFGRAVIKSDSFSLGQVLPNLANSVKNLRIDKAHLAAYQALMGFNRTSKLPATYLSMLGFPTALEIMTDAEFPMKAMGQVHLNNEITVYKDIELDANLDLFTAMTGSRVTSRGVEWTLDMHVNVDNELVWSSSSTMLYRCKTTEPRKPAASIGKQGIAQMWSVDSGLGRRYAQISGDYNPIHLTSMSAKLFGFKNAIAHGMWSKARCIAALQDQLPEAGYRVQANFHRPLFLPSDVLFYQDRQKDHLRFSLFNKSGQQAHLDGYITEDINHAKL
jgi:hypothetical protein